MNLQKNMKMEKKRYTAPHADAVRLSYTTTLLDWSAPKADGGGGNTPEAKKALLWQEDESWADYGMLNAGNRLWEEED